MTGKLIQTKQDVWNYWPLTTDPRETQVVAAEWAAELPSDKRFLMLEIPVGGGKSPLGLTLGGYFGGTSYILTPQRVLQKQYEDSFQRQVLASVYGRANYNCHKLTGIDCSVGPEMKLKCGETCTAKQAFLNGQATPNMVLNYKLAMLYCEVYSDDEVNFPIRDLMVFDECHTLERHLVEHRALAITKSKCEELHVLFMGDGNLVDRMIWIEEEYHPAVLDEKSRLDQAVQEIEEDYNFQTRQRSLRPSEMKTLRDFMKLKRHAARLEALMKLDPETLVQNYVLVPEYGKFTIKELYGSSLFKHLLQRKANKFLFMSSTILDKDAYCRDLGIKQNEAAFLSLGSEFDKESRPVYFMPTAKMSYGWDKKERTDDRNKMASATTKLCNMHSGESGIIHSGSFKIGAWLKDELEGNVEHEIVYHDPKGDMTRDELIEYYMDNAPHRPMVMISPSLTEGLDLKGDLGRFSIFVKVPYPFLGDAWVKRRMELSGEWYQRQALINIIQGGGRVVRTKEDWGNTYILDTTFGFLWSRTTKVVPTWWKESYKKVG